MSGLLRITTEQPRFTLPTYEGPLDLLLQLIRENEVDICDIPIAEITRQYLERLAQWQAMDLVVAGDYLVMAATLLEIKSRMLLPQPPPPEGEEADDPRAELVRRVLEYAMYAAAAEQFRSLEEHRARLFFRNAIEEPDDYVLPVQAGDLTAWELAAFLQRVLAGAGVQSAEPVTAIVPQQKVSLRLKMAEILRRVRRSETGIRFHELLDDAVELMEVVMAFLAVLELARTGRIRIQQRRPFGEVMLLPQEPGRAQDADHD